MYKVQYTKLAKMNDGTVGNISQGVGFAYMDCTLSEIEAKLQADLMAEEKRHKYFPSVDSVTQIDGHIVR
jgi:hypothetical protein